VCSFNDAVLRCFGTNVFQLAKIGIAKIAIASSYLKIIKSHLAIKCT